MRAVVCRELSGIEGLEVAELPDPTPGPGEVRIAVTTAALNFADSLITRGRYQIKPELPFVPGMECAGRIDALGAGVEDPAPGTRVLANPDYGAFAERVVVPAAQVVALPETIDDATAAALPVAHGTAYGALVWAARLQAGETLVVHGAAGGVGLAAVECGVALGAEVIATARGAERLGIARERGARHLVDTASEDLRGRLREITGARGADVVFDPIGGPVFEASLRAAAWGARLLIIGFAAGEIQQIPANILLVKNVHALGFHWGSYHRHAPALVRSGFEALFEWHAEARIRPHVSATFPLDQAREALTLMLERRSTGKVVLRITDPERKDGR